MFESKKKINVLAILLAMIFVFITPLNVSAYSRDGNKLNPNYSLTGNGASDIVAVSKGAIGEKIYRFFRISLQGMVCRFCKCVCGSRKSIECYTR